MTAEEIIDQLKIKGVAFVPKYDVLTHADALVKWAESLSYDIDIDYTGIHAIAGNVKLVVDIRPAFCPSFTRYGAEQ